MEKIYSRERKKEREGERVVEFSIKSRACKLRSFGKLIT